MDISIVMECSQCRLTFKQNFLEMEHGRALRCPSCFNPVLSIKGDTAPECQAGPDGFDRSIRARTSDIKTKP